MKQYRTLPQVPASAFSVVVGLAGLGNSWRVAHRVWHLPAAVGECILLVAGVVWLSLVVLFALKWVFSPGVAKAELRHPVQSTFINLVGIATNLMAIALQPYTWSGTVLLFASGSLISIMHGIFFTGFAWRGDRTANTVTGSLYLPTVAGCFVTGTAAASLGYKGLAQLALGAGIFSWISLESVLLNRLYASAEMPSEQRPSLGIQFAPAAVGAVTYLSIESGVPDIFSRALLGYAILQALVLFRLARWIARHPLDLSYWAFTFGAASLSTAACRMVEHGEQGAIRVLAPILFGGANVVIAFVSFVSLKHAGRALKSVFDPQASSRPVQFCPNGRR